MENTDFEPDDKELANFMRALGHPARLAVLNAIAQKGDIVEGETVKIPVISPATVIQHLRELKRAGLVQGRIFGANSRYGIDHENFQRFKEDFTKFMEKLDNIPPGSEAD